MQATFCDHCGRLALAKIRAGREGLTPVLVLDLCPKCETTIMKGLKDFIKIRTPQDIINLAQRDDPGPLAPAEKISIDDFADMGEGLSVRAYNVLKTRGFENLRQLLETPIPKLQRMPRLGPVTLDEVIRQVELAGYKLGENKE